MIYFLLMQDCSYTLDSPTSVIGPKWVLRNKMNEKGEVVRNRERLACKGYSQQEGVDYEEAFFFVAIIEVVRMFLSYAVRKKFIVYQINVKLVFLNGELEE